MEQIIPYNYHINFTHINECIYCGCKSDLTDLSREHIIPKSLNGLWVLPKASCSKCAKATSEIEASAINNMFDTIRKTDNFSSYHKSDTPKTIAADILLFNQVHPITIDVLPEYAIRTKSTVLFKPPQILKDPKRKQEPGWNWVGHKIQMINNDAHSNIFKENNNLKSISFPTGTDISSYSLMLAKIAHSYAAGMLGINTFTAYLTKYILNKDSSELDYYLGCEQQTEWNPPINVMHEASIELIPHPTIGVRRILVLVNLRILSYLGGPYTQIVVGHLESDAALSQIHKKLKYKLPLSTIDKPKIRNSFPIRVDYNPLRKYVQYYHHKI